MIGNVQLKEVYKKSLNDLIYTGRIDTTILLQKLKQFTDEHNAQFPIIKPELYDRLETNATPYKINNNYTSIESDLIVIENTIDTINNANTHMERVVKLELDSFKNRIQNLRTLITKINTSSHNAINIIPDYVDISSTTATLIADKNIAMSGDMLTIYKEQVIPINIDVKVSSTHTSEQIYGDGQPDDSTLEIIVSSKEPIQQSVDITFTTSSPINALLLKTDNSYMLKTNITNNNLSLYNELLITSEIGDINKINLTLYKDTYDEIKNGYFLYYFNITDYKLYRSSNTKYSILKTKDIEIEEGYILLEADYTGVVNATMSVDGGNDVEIEIGEIQQLNNMVYASPSPILSNDEKSIKILTGVNANDYINIIGPIGAFEYNGNKYYTTLKVTKTGTFSYNYNYYISTSNNILSYTAGDSVQLEPGIYTLYVDSIGTLTFDGEYEIYINHKYYMITPNPNNVNYDYPKYTYLIIDNTLHISANSLVNIYSSGQMVDPLLAAEYLKIYRKENKSSTVRFTFALDKNAVINNLKLITTDMSTLIGGTDDFET